jgi:hypothetical protein
MIQANELRIGNHLISNRYGLDEIGNPRIVIVEMIDYDGINTEHWRDGCEPNHTFEQLSALPITSEILEKFGFKEMIDGTPENGQLKYWEFNNFKLFQFTNLMPGYMIFAFDHLLCNYVHILQNLFFAMTGTELKQIEYEQKEI